MTKPQIPDTDSIEALATFWQSHDLTDFADELQEVEAPALGHAAEGVRVPLTHAEREALRKMASSLGREETALIRQWVREKLPQL